MQAGPARYVSVSELYSTDEVELLLDEIRELEPTSCRGEDVQATQEVSASTTINSSKDVTRPPPLQPTNSASYIGHSGSALDNLIFILSFKESEHSSLHSSLSDFSLLTIPTDFEIAGSGCGAGAGGRSPAGTELTERSWDSHAQYRRAPPPRPRPLAPLYCRLRHLLTPTGAATLLLVVCSAGACACVWAGAGLRVARVPQPGRVRLLLLGALTSLLLHSALLVLHVTRLTALLPLDWNKLGACTSLWSLASLALGGGLTLQGAGGARLLLAGAGLALLGAGAAAALLAAAARRGLRRPRAWAGAAYRAVPPAPAPEPAPAPSTSREPPL